MKLIMENWKRFLAEANCGERGVYFDGATGKPCRGMDIESLSPLQQNLYKRRVAAYRQGKKSKAEPDAEDTRAAQAEMNVVAEKEIVRLLRLSSRQKNDRWYLFMYLLRASGFPVAEALQFVKAVSPAGNRRFSRPGRAIVERLWGAMSVERARDHMKLNKNGQDILDVVDKIRESRASTGRSTGHGTPQEALRDIVANLAQKLIDIPSFLVVEPDPDQTETM
jgi:hypothetical protein